MSDWIEEYKSFSSKDWKPTTLSDQDEIKFKNWLQGTKLFNSIKMDVAKENNIEVSKIDNIKIINMLTSQGDYDYRGAWKSGIKEVISPVDNRPHWPSSAGDKMLKSPKHETAWKEFFMRQYNKDPDDLGLSTFDKAKQWSEGRLKTKMQNEKERKRLLLNNIGEY